MREWKRNFHLILCAASKNIGQIKQSIKNMKIFQFKPSQSEGGSL